MSAADAKSSTIRYLPTKEAYDRWASVYDTDGNFLQAMDDIEMRALLPRFEAAIRTTASQPLKLVDLGCGTGRNTALLLGIQNARIIALDASEGMLAVADKKLKQVTESGDCRDPRLQLGVFDLLTSDQPLESAKGADGVISTLVLEHVPLDTFFKHVSEILKPGGILLLTNMHSEMGQISQAGFVDAGSGEKIRPVSYAHTVNDVVREAERWGLVLESASDGMPPHARLEEIAVSEDMVDKLGPRSQKWVGVTCWFGGLMKKTES